MATLDDLMRAVEELPKLERQVMTLLKFYGYTGPEIALKLGISEEEVRSIAESAWLKIWRVAE